MKQQVNVLPFRHARVWSSQGFSMLESAGDLFRECLPYTKAGLGWYKSLLSGRKRWKLDDTTD